MFSYNMHIWHDERFYGSVYGTQTSWLKFGKDGSFVKILKKLTMTEAQELPSFKYLIKTTIFPDPNSFS